MNIVIANGPGILDNGNEVILFPSRWDSGVRGKKPFAFYPYELAYLSAMLKRELLDANVTFLDGNLESWGADRYIDEIVKLQPDFLICECSALTYSTMTRVMQAVVKRGSSLEPCISILCGPMAGTKQSREQANHDGWSECFAGEYELDILGHLKGSVPDAARTDAGLVNLDWLPWPEDEDVDRSRYYEINHHAPPAMIQMYPSRGCPLSCTFCVVPSYYGGHGKTARSHRCRDVNDVCDEIEYLAARYPNFNGCYFNEEAHNANDKWFASLCEKIIERGLDRYQYDAMCGVWSFNEDLVKLAARAGYKQIRFGVESTSEQVGQAIKKSLHLEKIERFMGWCKAQHVNCYITLQVGALGSTEAIDLQTIKDAKRWIREGKVQRWQLSTSTPQIGTPFYEQCKKNGWLVTEDVNLYDGINAVVNLPDYPAHRIQAVRDGAGL